jgi:hypothetical protein
MVKHSYLSIQKQKTQLITIFLTISTALHILLEYPNVHPYRYLLQKGGNQFWEDDYILQEVLRNLVKDKSTSLHSPKIEPVD